jgi:crossover junction endodeoxyribonuclease RusA
MSSGYTIQKRQTTDALRAAMAPRSYVVNLPWVNMKLSQNGRMHWRPKASLTAAYKRDCFVLCLAANVRKTQFKKIRLNVKFNPPDYRGRDDDNIISAFKSGRDGIALALGLDDKHFKVTYNVGDIIPGGQVTVHIIEEA